MGEATHGTHEFYRERARVTRRLIEKNGFTGVVLEANWTDMARVDQYLRGEGSDRSAVESLGDIKDFPRWMWRNEETLDLINWLRERNDRIAEEAAKVSVYGMDVYGVFPSIQQGLEQLALLDSAAAEQARSSYHCFERYRSDAEEYATAVATRANRSCERGASEQLAAIITWSRGRSLTETQREIAFQAEQNARVVASGEHYYRIMAQGGHESWNVRDTHMADTIDAISRHHRARGAAGKLIVWAHNSHVGDARATEFGANGQLNVGQLTRQRHPDETFLIGFTTFSGTVVAASAWGSQPEVKRLGVPIARSVEELFHRVGVPNFLLLLRGSGLAEDLNESRPERAVGVIHFPWSERFSHYFNVRLYPQFDAVIHLDETRALTPLDPLRR